MESKCVSLHHMGVVRLGRSGSSSGQLEGERAKYDEKYCHRPETKERGIYQEIRRKKSEPREMDRRIWRKRNGETSRWKAQ